MSPKVKHVLLVALTAALGASVELFGPKGPWSHAFWAPVAVALVSDLKVALGGGAPPAALVWALALNASLLGASCAHTSAPVTTFGHCSTQALETAAQSILGRVTTALATGDYVDQLAALATEVGGAEVGCAVDLVIAEFTVKAARTDDTEVNVILVHAQAWRGSNP